MRRHIVFDLDGTLVDSLPGIAEGVNRALVSLGRSPHAPQAVRGMIGRGAANLCAAALGYPDAELTPKEELQAMHSAFMREYPHCWQGEGTRPYPGILSMVRSLAAAGAKLAVLSNKPHEVTLPMVRTLFPDVPFSPLWGFSGRFPRKPAPDALLAIATEWGVRPQDLTLVGDSLFDARTASNAACSCLLVAWGYASTADLEDWPAPLCRTVPDLQAKLLGSPF
ncbi:MAG: HAD family hydrolase [Akkermansia muciniphila]